MAKIEIRRTDSDEARLCLSGGWTLKQSLPEVTDLTGSPDLEPLPKTLGFSTEELRDWDSGLLTFLSDLQAFCDANGVAFDPSGLPEGARRLLKLASAVPEKEGARKQQSTVPLFEKVGQKTLDFNDTLGGFFSFLGEAVQSFGRVLRGRVGFQRADLVAIMEDCGSAALPIVSLISLLVGMILAFVGAVQLQQFGAQIYVADLVGIATAREMGAMMTAIIMAGRTGAAFAAQLGTMQVNEEIDAMRTFGIEPMDFLVLPRMLALILMMPILVLYANLLGIGGGLLVGVGMLDITMTQYVNQTISALGWQDFAVGLVKSAVFGVLVAVAGCYHGIQCGRSASAVGSAATSAVVMGIVLIIVTDGVFAVVTTVLGI